MHTLTSFRSHRATTPPSSAAVSEGSHTHDSMRSAPSQESASPGARAGCPRARGPGLRYRGSRWPMAVSGSTGHPRLNSRIPITHFNRGHSRLPRMSVASLRNRPARLRVTVNLRALWPGPAPLRAQARLPGTWSTATDPGRKRDGTGPGAAARARGPSAYRTILHLWRDRPPGCHSNSKPYRPPPAAAKLPGQDGPLAFPRNAQESSVRDN